jgi:ferredoxin-type protein NapG/ferredoxin-type protein NapH
LLPGEVRAITRFGTARILTRLCLNHGWTPREEDDEPCERCLDWCPVPGALTMGDDAIPGVDAALCTGCGLCAQHCAAYPQAIAIK